MGAYERGRVLSTGARARRAAACRRHPGCGILWAMDLAAAVPPRLIVAITGASGSIYGVRLLEMLRGTGIETHLVLSQWAARTLVHETSYTVADVQTLARFLPN